MDGFTSSEFKYRLNDSIVKKNVRKAVPLDPRAKRTLVEDVKTFDANFTFLQTKLAKLHSKMYEPKSYFTYQEDIPVETGGGFVDYIEFYTVDWAGIVKDTRNLFGNGGNLIPRVNAGMNQNRAKVFTYEVAYDLRFVELEKMKKAQLSKSVEQIYQDIIRVGWDYFCQGIGYLGERGVGGLFTSNNVQATTVDNSGTTGSGFEGLDDDVVVATINGIFTDMLKESNMNINLIPDTILVPTFVSEDLVNRFSALYSASLFEFIKEHNLGRAQAGDKFNLKIVARPDLDTLGTAGKGRIVAYRRDKDYVRLDMPYPIQHYITLPNMERASYTSLFVGQVSEIQLPYNPDGSHAGIVRYYDFTN